MCGLVGVAGRIAPKDVDVFKQLLYIDYLRGEHSTGVGAVHEYTGEIRTVKATCDPLMLFQLKKGVEYITSSNKVLMGHNRHATRGKVSSVNAHPFNTGRILGAHNGTLDFSCLKDLSENDEGETDSERLINTIHDLDGNVADALALCEGAWALSIYDKDENTIQLVHNNQRPLFYCFAESLQTLYWASEAWMLDGVLNRNGIKRKSIISIEVDTVLTWILPKSNEVFGEEPGLTKAEGKQRTNFPLVEDAPWRHWGPQGQRELAVNNGGSGYGAKPDDIGKFDEDDESGWGVYGEGWEAGHTHGKMLHENPHDNKTCWIKWDRWREGFQSGRAYLLDKERHERIERASVLEADKAAREAEGIKEVEVKVVNLDEKRDESKKSDIYKTRQGPDKKKITKVKFRELTKDECGWCNDPVEFEDKGHFLTTPSHGSLYVCETCVNRGDFSEEIKQQGLAANAS